MNERRTREKESLRHWACNHADDGAAGDGGAGGAGGMSGGITPLSLSIAQ